MKNIFKNVDVKSASVGAGLLLAGEIIGVGIYKGIRYAGKLIKASKGAEVEKPEETTQDNKEEKKEE